MLVNMGKSAADVPCVTAAGDEEVLTLHHLTDGAR